MKPSILVVCHANVCRSPIAEGLLARRLPHFIVASAGVAASDGQPADPLACEVMQARGIDISAHRSRRLDARLCEEAALLLVMELEQRRYIERCFPLVRGRVFSLGLNVEPHGAAAYFDIADPHRGPRAAFEACATQMIHAIDAWARRIETLPVAAPSIDAGAY
ncbi:MAG TPA: low molecular weight protein-tyrosine-phosphatase [Paraburkholderia sp.]|jgi:protein-tyrosine phosphatase